MASSFFLLIAALALLISSALSQSCKSQIFSQRNVTFSNCTDLPTLNANIHWHYDPTAKPKPTFSVAFTAPPAKPDGWVAWGLNPTAAGMIGTQALAAFKDSDGSPVVKTYNISSYGPISESKISYDVLSKRTEFSKGLITIIATLALPEPSVKLNQVWQVGSAVVNGVPAKHDFAPDNLNSKTTLQLVSAGESGNAPAPSPAAGGRQSGGENGAGARVWGSGTGVFGISVLLFVSIFDF